MPCETAAISVHTLCTPYSNAPVYGVTLCKATHIYIYIHIYIHGACVLSCKLLSALLAEWPGSFCMLLRRHRGGMNTQRRVGTESWSRRRKFSRTPSVLHQHLLPPVCSRLTWGARRCGSVVRAPGSWLKSRGFRSCRSSGRIFVSGGVNFPCSYSGVRSTPVLLQQHVKDPGRSSKYSAALRM